VLARGSTDNGPGNVTERRLVTATRVCDPPGPAGRGIKTFGRHRGDKFRPLSHFGSAPTAHDKRPIMPLSALLLRPLPVVPCGGAGFLLAEHAFEMPGLTGQESDESNLVAVRRGLLTTSVP
jgi:hypothetical protein